MANDTNDIFDVDPFAADPFSGGVQQADPFAAVAEEDPATPATPDQASPEEALGLDQEALAPEPDVGLDPDVGPDPEEGVAEEEEDDTPFFSLAEVPKAIAAGTESFARDFYGTLDYIIPEKGVLSFMDIPTWEKDEFTLGIKLDSTTGKFLKEVVNFGLGFVPIVGVAGKIGVTAKLTTGFAKAFKKAGVGADLAESGARWAGRLGVETAAGAAVDFAFYEKGEQRLSTMLNENPDLEAFVPDFLADNMDETELEARLKASLEGSIMGLAFEPLFLSFKGIKAVRKAIAKGDHKAAHKAQVETANRVADSMDPGRLDPPEPHSDLSTNPEREAERFTNDLPEGSVEELDARLEDDYSYEPSTEYRPSRKESILLPNLKDLGEEGHVINAHLGEALSDDVGRSIRDRALGDDYAKNVSEVVADVVRKGETDGIQKLGKIIYGGLSEEHTNTVKEAIAAHVAGLADEFPAASEIISRAVRGENVTGAELLEAGLSPDGAEAVLDALQDTISGDEYLLSLVREGAEVPEGLEAVVSHTRKIIDGAVRDGLSARYGKARAEELLIEGGSLPGGNATAVDISTVKTAAADENSAVGVLARNLPNVEKADVVAALANIHRKMEANPHRSAEQAMDIIETLQAKVLPNLDDSSPEAIAQVFHIFENYFGDWDVNPESWGESWQNLDNDVAQLLDNPSEEALELKLHGIVKDLNTPEGQRAAHKKKKRTTLAAYTLLTHFENQTRDALAKMDVEQAGVNELGPALISMERANLIKPVVMQVATTAAQILNTVRQAAQGRTPKTKKRAAELAAARLGNDDPLKSLRASQAVRAGEAAFPTEEVVSEFPELARVANELVGADLSDENTAEQIAESILDAADGDVGLADELLEAVGAGIENKPRKPRKRRKPVKKIPKPPKHGPPELPIEGGVEQGPAQRGAGDPGHNLRPVDFPDKPNTARTGEASKRKPRKKLSKAERAARAERRRVENAEQEGFIERAAEDLSERKPPTRKIPKRPKQGPPEAPITGRVEQGPAPLGSGDKATKQEVHFPDKPNTARNTSEAIQKHNKEKANAEAVERAGGVKVARKLLGDVKIQMRTSKRPGIAAKHFASLNGKKGFKEMFEEFRIGTLLSGIKTVATSLTSISAYAVFRPMAIVLGSAFAGKNAGKVIRGGMHEMTGFYKNLREGWNVGRAVFKDEKVRIGNTVYEHTTDHEAITAEGFGLAEDHPMASWVNSFGRIVRIPTRILNATDQIVAQMQARSTTTRDFAERLIMKGEREEVAYAHAEEAVASQFDDGHAFLPERLYEEGLSKARAGGAEDQKAAHQIALDYAQARISALGTDADDFIAANRRGVEVADQIKMTSTLPTQGFWVGPHKLSEFTRHNWLARMVIPFVRTPSNLVFATGQFFDAPGLASYMYHKFSGRLEHLAETSAGRHKFVQDMVSGDPFRESEARGRLMMGAMATLTVGLAYQSGSITGGGPQNPRRNKMWRDAGWQPYSFRTADGTYYSYNKVDPFSSVLSTTADFFEYLSLTAEADPDAEKDFMAAIQTVIATNLHNKSYLAGLTDAMQAISDPGGSKFTKVSGSVAATVVPTLLYDAVKAEDGMQREVRGFVDQFRKKLPGLRDDLPLMYNVYGQPLDLPAGLGSEADIMPGVGGALLNMSMLATTSTVDGPLDEELALIGRGFGPPTAKVNRSIDLREYDAPGYGNAYARYQALVGEVVIGGRTLRESVEELLNTDSYQNLPPESTDALLSPRIERLNKMIRRYRRMALRELRKEIPKIQEDTQSLNQQRRALLGVDMSF